MAATDCAGAGPSTPAGRILAAALALPLAVPVLAQGVPDRATLSLRVLDYQDSQPGADRVRVKAPALALAMPIAGPWSLGASVVSDAISGASPAYHTRALSRLSDERNAADVTLTRAFDDATLSVGAAGSHESDYDSAALSLQGTWSSDDRNTTWAGGLAASRDRINPVTAVVQGARKRVLDAHLGLTRVFSATSVWQVNLGLNHARGYLSDPYKVFDVRPAQRDALRLLVRGNHHLRDGGQTVRWSWRMYRDDWKVRAYTLGLEWVQPLAAQWSVTPALRLHSQDRARFYVEVDPDAAPFVTQPPPGAIYSSLDQRLSAFGAVTAGLKLAWQPDPDWTLDVKFERYAQRGRWHWRGEGSTGLAAFDARTWQFGVARRF